MLPFPSIESYYCKYLYTICLKYLFIIHFTNLERQCDLGWVHLIIYCKYLIIIIYLIYLVRAMRSGVGSFNSTIYGKYLKITVYLYQPWAGNAIWGGSLAFHPGWSCRKLVADCEYYFIYYIWWIFYIRY